MTKLFRVPIFIINESQALALVGEWLREWRIPNTEYRIPNGAKKSSPSPNSVFSIQNSVFPKIIVTPNPEIIAAAQSDPELMKALQSADLSIPDGIGIIWALKLLGRTVEQYNSETVVSESAASKTVTAKQVSQSTESTDSPTYRFTDYRSTVSPFHCLTGFARLSGLDLMESLLLQPQKVAPYELRPLKVMLLGGRPGVAQAAAKKLSAGKTVKQYNGETVISKTVTGKPVNRPTGLPAYRPTDYRSTVLPSHRSTVVALSGPQNIADISRSENNRLIAQINSFFPDLLFVAFGHPKQEKWLIANRESLTVGVAMAVGGAFDQIADPSLRPPLYINSIGLGWLYRLLRQPWRIKRQLALVKFAGMVIKDRVLEDRNS